MNGNEKPWSTDREPPVCFIDKVRVIDPLTGPGLLNPGKKLKFSSSQFGVNVKPGEILPVIQF